RACPPKRMPGLDLVSAKRSARFLAGCQIVMNKPKRVDPPVSSQPPHLFDQPFRRFHPVLAREEQRGAAEGAVERTAAAGLDFDEAFSALLVIAVDVVDQVKSRHRKVIEVAWDSPWRGLHDLIPLPGRPTFHPGGT